MSDVIKFPGALHHPSQKKSRVVADLADGFTRIANDLQKAKCKLRMAGCECSVLDAVIYSTLGWNKKKDFITNTYLAELCGMDPANVSKALKELARRNIITLEKSRYMKIVGINMVVSEWELARNKPQKGLGNSAKELGNNAKKVRRFDPLEQVKTPNTQDSLTQDNKKEIKPFSSQIADPLYDHDRCDPDSASTDKIRPDAATQTPNGKFWGTQGDLACAEYIHGKVLEVNSTASIPSWPRWANEIRLMRVQDGRTHLEIRSLFEWANCETFWSTNVQCPQSLRKHWNKLQAKRVGQHRQHAHSDKSNPTKSMTAETLNQLIFEGY